MKCFVWNTRGDIIGDSIKESALFEYLSYSHLSIETNGTKIIGSLHQNNPYLSKFHTIPEQRFLTSNKNKLAKLFYLIKSIMSVRSLLLSCDVCVLTQKLWHPYYIVSRLYCKKILLKKDLDYTKIVPRMYLTKKDCYELPVCKKRLVINIESKDKSRCWGIKNYGEVIEKISSDYQIILLGTSKEYNGSLVNKLNKPIINLVGMTNIRETAAIIQSADLYLGNDSGLSHIAAAVSTDVLNVMINSTVDIYSGNKVLKLRKPMAKKVAKTINEW